MDRLLVEVGADRNRCGRLSLIDASGRTICGPFAVAARSSDALAAANGNSRRDPLLRFGDTPLGGYAIRQLAKSGKGTKLPTPQFGPHGIIVIEAISGDAACAEATGRFHFLISGGDLAAGGQLRSTAGSLRLSNKDQRKLFAALQKKQNVHCEIVRCDRLPDMGIVFDDPACADDDPPRLPRNGAASKALAASREALRGTSAMVLGFTVSFVVAQGAAPARASINAPSQSAQAARESAKFIPPATRRDRPYTRLAYDTTGPGYGIPGLPGIYTGGPSDGGSAAPPPDNSGGAAPPPGDNGDNGGAAPPPADNQNPPAPPADGGDTTSGPGYGIPGLPGIYTNGPRSDDGGGAAAPADNSQPAPAGGGDSSNAPPDNSQPAPVPTDGGDSSNAPPDNSQPAPAPAGGSDSSNAPPDNSQPPPAPVDSSNAPPDNSQPAPAPLDGSDITNDAPNSPPPAPSGGGNTTSAPATANTPPTSVPLTPFANPPPQDVGPAQQGAPVPADGGDTKAIDQLRAIQQSPPASGGAEQGVDTGGLTKPVQPLPPVSTPTAAPVLPPVPGLTPAQQTTLNQNQDYQRDMAAQAGAEKAAADAAAKSAAIQRQIQDAKDQAAVRQLQVDLAKSKQAESTAKSQADTAKVKAQQIIDVVKLQ